MKKKTNILRKSNTWEWITIHTKTGLTYERRQRKKVPETAATSAHDKAERLAEWKNKDSLAGLKDKLAISVKYNHNYYDSNGDPVYVPPRYQDIVEEFHHSKNNDSTFTNFLTGNETDLEKQKKQKLIGLIKLKDKLFQQEYAKKKQFMEVSMNNPATIMRNIKSFLGTINAGRSSVDDMYYALNYVRSRIDSSIDPTIQITISGKTQTKTLNELLERLKAAKASKKGDTRKNTGVEKYEIENIDHYAPEDFVQLAWQMTPTDHAEIVNRVNKKFSGLKKKSNFEKGMSESTEENDNFYKALSDELGVDYQNYIEGNNDFQFFVIEKALKGKTHLVRKTKLIHRDGKTFFATYWVNPTTGEKTSNEKIEGLEAYEGRHEEFATGDTIRFYSRKKGAFETGIVKKLVVDKKYPEGMVLVSTADDPDIAVGLKSAKAIVKVSSTTAKTEPTVVKKTASKDFAATILKDSVVNLGGSSGVKAYTTTDGVTITVKVAHKGNVKQLQNEVLVDNIYRLFGFFAPTSRLEKLDGKDVKVAEFIPNMQALGCVFNKKAAYKEVREGFVLDALLGNWDVIGANEDNVLVNKENGAVMRVDNGGSMFFRARGGEKEFGSEIKELKTFIDGTNPVTARVYKDITEEEIIKQAKDILNRKMELIELLASTKDLDLRVAKALGERLDWLEKYVKTPVKAKEPEAKYDKTKYPSKATQDFFETGWDTLNVEGNVGIKDHIKKRILKFEKQYEEAYKEHARKHGLTLEEYKVKAQQKLEKLIGESDFFRATDANYLEHILLKDGRYKSQFEVGRSDGSYSPRSRANAEHEYFGFPNDVLANKEKRPIYGYYSNDKNGAINSAGANPPPNSVANYGRVTVKIKKEVALRKATITLEDSLGESSRIPSVFAAKPHFTMFGDNDILRSDVVDTKRQLAYSYTEAQYHNQLTTDDIEEIIFSTKNYSHEPKAIEELNHMIRIARQTKIPVRFY